MLKLEYSNIVMFNKVSIYLKQYNGRTAVVPMQHKGKCFA